MYLDRQVIKHERSQRTPQSTPTQKARGNQVFPPHHTSSLPLRACPGENESQKGAREKAKGTSCANHGKRRRACARQPKGKKRKDFVTHANNGWIVIQHCSLHVRRMSFDVQILDFRGTKHNVIVRLRVRRQVFMSRSAVLGAHRVH